MKSMYSLPSTSQTWLPAPRSMNSGDAPMGSAVRDFEKVCEPSGMTASARASWSRERR